MLREIDSTPAMMIPQRGRIQGCGLAVDLSTREGCKKRKHFMVRLFLFMVIASAIEKLQDKRYGSTRSPDQLRGVGAGVLLCF